MMESINLAIAVLVALVSLLAGVATVVWAVAQIKETTSNLAIQISHLAKEIATLSDRHEDHETRIRKIEQRE
jgi:cell division protein FtsB